MNSLSLDIFLQSADDAELSRYKVLASIKSVNESLHHNKLYPEFAQFINLYNQLRDLLAKGESLSGSSPGNLIGFDLENKKAVYESNKISDDKTKKVFDFINWALPKIKGVIEEGKAIFDFIDGNLEVSQVGILPIYKKEGYFIIPDNEEGNILVYRYEMTLFPAEGEQFHTLKTVLVDAINSTIVKPENIKLDLIKQYPELPNPAAYRFNIDIDFPFNESVLPIAKRKLIRELAA